MHDKGEHWEAWCAAIVERQVNHSFDLAMCYVGRMVDGRNSGSSWLE